MKIVASTLVALSVLAGVAGQASAQTYGHNVTTSQDQGSTRK